MRWVFFDISYLAHRAFHTMGGMEHDNSPTGVVYGVLDQIRRVCLHPRIASNCAVAFFDSVHSVRREFFPEYKQHRGKERTEEEQAEYAKLRDQIVYLQSDLLPSIGIHCYRQRGMESDDLMAWGARALTVDKNTTDTVVLVTADNDLIQCVSRKVHWFDPMRDLYLKPQDVLANKGVLPKQWASVKALAGCHSDNVPGVGGVGEKTAIDYLRGSLLSGKKYDRIVSNDGRKIIRRNKQLVILPHLATQAFRPEPPKYSWGAFVNACNTLGFTSFVNGNRAAEWKSFFKRGAGGASVPVRKRGEVYG